MAILRLAISVCDEDLLAGVKGLKESMKNWRKNATERMEAMKSWNMPLEILQIIQIYVFDFYYFSKVHFLLSKKAKGKGNPKK